MKGIKMNQQDVKQDQQEVFTKDFNRIYKVITAQADLRSINWVNGHAWGVDDVSLRKLRNHEKKVLGNLKNLEAWAGRTQPRGEYLQVARYIYKAYKREIVRVQETILELSEILDKKTEV